MSRVWGREEQPELAVARILDAAGRAFAELGVSCAGMGEIARVAGCSRGTLYRYFPRRHALHLAYVERAARRIAARVRTAAEDRADPGERLAEAVLAALREVRADPGVAAWFEPGASGMAARMSRSSEVVATVTGRFAAELLGGRARDAEGRLLARWIVRVIVSLLTLPEESEIEERALVQRFVAPLVAGAPRRGSRRRAARGVV